MLTKLTKSPMGWNSWDCYGPSVDEKTVRANAEVMAKKLKAFGWEYIVVDIQWYQPTARSHDYIPFADLNMDGYGRLLPAENRFPSAADGKGFGPLADFVHALGLKFGIHIMRGIPRQAVYRDTPVLGTDKTARQIAKTDSICHWNTDMYGVDPEKEGARAYYESIFQLYADWGVDFIKCDDICRELPHEEAELVLLSDCVRSCDREMVLSLSPGPALLEKAELYKQYAQMWRITDDFWDKWELLLAMFERCEKWSIHTGAGCYPDADMLPVGAILQNLDPEKRTNFTADEQYTMLTLWSIFRAPLMIGGDLTKLDDFTKKLLSNANILAMHEYARHAHQVWRKNTGSANAETVLWTALSAKDTGAQYAAVFNLGEAENRVEIPLADIEPLAALKTAEALWSGEQSAIAETADTPAAQTPNCPGGQGVLSCTLPPHGCAAWKLTA